MCTFLETFSLLPPFAFSIIFSHCCFSCFALARLSYLLLSYLIFYMLQKFYERWFFFHISLIGFHGLPCLIHLDFANARISFKCGKMIIKVIIPGRSCRVRFCGETIASPSGSFFWKEGVNRHDQQNCLMHSKITRLVTYEAVSFKEMSMRICIHRVFS